MEFGAAASETAASVTQSTNNYSQQRAHNPPLEIAMTPHAPPAEFVPSGDAGATNAQPKIRKQYRISKQRELWTEEEHTRFVEALKIHGREWKLIEQYVGTKSLKQIRSHAQKFFLKAEKTGNGMFIPPPRVKRRSSDTDQAGDRGSQSADEGSAASSGLSVAPVAPPPPKAKSAPRQYVHHKTNKSHLPGDKSLQSNNSSHLQHLPESAASSIESMVPSAKDFQLWMEQEVSRTNQSTSTLMDDSDKNLNSTPQMILPPQLLSNTAFASWMSANGLLAPELMSPSPPPPPPSASASAVISSSSVVPPGHALPHSQHQLQQQVTAHPHATHHNSLQLPVTNSTSNFYYSQALPAYSSSPSPSPMNSMTFLHHFDQMRNQINHAQWLYQNVVSASFLSPSTPSSSQPPRDNSSSNSNNNNNNSNANNSTNANASNSNNSSNSALASALAVGQAPNLAKVFTFIGMLFDGTCTSQQEAFSQLSSADRELVQLMMLQSQQQQQQTHTTDVNSNPFFVLSPMGVVDLMVATTLQHQQLQQQLQQQSYLHPQYHIPQAYRLQQQQQQQQQSQQQQHSSSATGSASPASITGVNQSAVPILYSTSSSSLPNDNSTVVNSITIPSNTSNSTTPKQRIVLPATTTTSTKANTSVSSTAEYNSVSPLVIFAGQPADIETVVATTSCSAVTSSSGIALPPQLMVTRPKEKPPIPHTGFFMAVPEKATSIS